MVEISDLKKIAAELRADVNTEMMQLPKYRALLQIEEAIKELESGKPRDLFSGVREEEATAKQTVVGLAVDFIRKAGTPQTMQDIFNHIHSVKNFDDVKKGKMNVVSALSKDKKRVRSIMWNNQHAWWVVGEALPKMARNGHALAASEILTPSPVASVSQ